MSKLCTISLCLMIALLLAMTSGRGAEQSPPPAAGPDRDEQQIRPSEGRFPEQPPRDDEELARITQDILLLRRINRIGLSKEQIEKALPLLQQLLDEQKRFREETKEQLLKYRNRLIGGDIAEQEERAAAREMDELRRRQREDSRKTRQAVVEVLGQEQGRELLNLVSVGFVREPQPPGPPPADSERPREPRRSGPSQEPGQGGEQRPRGPQQPGDDERPPRLGRPETVLTRLIELLEEKLKLLEQQAPLATRPQE